MAKRFIGCVAALTCALYFGNSATAQDIGRFAELYSNADGSRQFVVLEVGPFTSLDIPMIVFLGGQTLIASNGGTEHRFTFPKHYNAVSPAYPSQPINGRWVCDGDESMPRRCVAYMDILIATQAIDDLDAVKADYVVPDGFLFSTNGSVRLGNIEFHYDTLPLDGLNARWGDAGQVRPAQAYSLTGGSYSFINYSGLWWADPAGSESGWGINFSHQGNTIFGTWFTYDANGKPVWLTMIARRRETDSDWVWDRFYDGEIYRHNGAPFGAFVPPATATRAGSVTVGFANATNARIDFYVNDGPNIPSHAKSKAIVLQTFGSAPTCLWGIQPELTKATNYQGLWWAAPAESESGWGVNLTHQGNTIFATWFTYDASRNPLWLSVSATQTGSNTYSGTLDRTTGPAFGTVPFGPVQHQSVGRATFDFANGNAGTFAYDVDLGDGVNRASQSKAITRQVFHSPGTVCN